MENKIKIKICLGIKQKKKKINKRSHSYELCPHFYFAETSKNDGALVCGINFGTSLINHSMVD